MSCRRCDEHNDRDRDLIIAILNKLNQLGDQMSATDDALAALAATLNDAVTRIDAKIAELGSAATPADLATISAAVAAVDAIVPAPTPAPVDVPVPAPVDGTDPNAPQPANA
jgi:hypothetical protein